jgi:hypothetical protein
MISIIRAAPKPFRPGRLPSKMPTEYHAVYGSQTGYLLGRPNPGARQRNLKDKYIVLEIDRKVSGVASPRDRSACSGALRRSETQRSYGLRRGLGQHE